MRRFVLWFLCKDPRGSQPSSKIPPVKLVMQPRVKDKLILHIVFKKSAVVNFIVPIQLRRKCKLILISYPIQTLVIDDPL
jgi:hypothetical protein